MAAALLPRALIALLVGWGLSASTLLVDAVSGVRLPVPATNARVLLGALAGAILTIAVFALWMRTVMVGLAAAHVSPRVVSSYLDDDFQRRMTAWMIAGFAYVLGVLAFLPPNPADDTVAGVPAISILVATVVAVAALLTVLLAIHHAVTSLSLSALVRDLADRALAVMELPQRPDDEPPADLSRRDTDAVIIRSDEMGWVQNIDYPALLGALPAGAVLTLHTSVGEFVAKGEPMAGATELVNDEAHDEIRDAVTLAATRRADDDLAFAIQQLVDVAQHATTPASNDTSTADEALVHLRAVMHELVRKGKRSGCLVGSDGRAIVSASVWHPADHLEAAFERLRFGAARMPTAVDRVLHTIDALERTAREVGDERSRETLRCQRDRLSRAAEPHDVTAPTAPL